MSEEPSPRDAGADGRAWKSRRPSAMAFTCLLALLITGNVGMWLELSGSKAALAQQQSRELDEQVRHELRTLGWTPPTSPALRSLSASLYGSQGVELLGASSAFELPLDNGTVSGEPAEQSALTMATRMAFDELSLLPRSLLESIGLRRVVMVQRLTEARRPIPSLPNYRGTLLLDVDAAEPFLRRLLHHEVFHFADVADDGVLQIDHAWLALNPDGFRYGRGGRSMRAPSAGAFTRDVPGFVTRYATSALEEDKAELFAFMLTEPAAVASLAESDAVLARKVARMKQLVVELSADAGEGFWLRVDRFRAR